VRTVSARLKKDQLTLYAAQASFFVLFSALPQLVLILNISRLLREETAVFLFDLLRTVLPAELYDSLSEPVRELQNSGTLPILSAAAATALWSASRGISALERGLRGVYRITAGKGLLSDAFYALIHTAVFIVILPASLLFLVFGAQLAELAVRILPASQKIIDPLLNTRGIFILFLLIVLFTLEHRSILKRARRKNRCLPGAAASAAGWMLFSYLYSLYLRFFQRTSYLYGGLAIILSLMLWVYFSMIIFLLGAEINKFLFSRTEI